MVVVVGVLVVAQRATTTASDAAPPPGSIEPTVIEVGSKPSDIAVTPDGRRAYVSTDDGVAVIDPATDTVITTIPSPAFAVLAVSPDGSRAYIASTETAGGAIGTVVDTATDGVVARVPIGRAGRLNYPLAATVSADGQRVLVVSQVNYDDATHVLSVIDAADGAVVAEIAVPEASSDLAVSPDGATAYVPQFAGGAISVIDVADGAVVAEIPVKFPQNIASSPDGSRAYVTGLNDAVVVIDTASGAVATTVPFPSSAGPVAISADGARVFVAEGHSISVIDTATSTRSVPIPSTPGLIEDLAVMPDGRLYLITGGSLSVIDIPV